MISFNPYTVKSPRTLENLLNKIDDQKILNEYINKHNSNSKNEMLKSYDLYLNNKYKVDTATNKIDIILCLFNFFLIE